MEPWKIVKEATIHKDGVSRIKITFEEVSMGSPVYGELLDKELARGATDSIEQFAKEFVETISPRLSQAETEVLIAHLQKTLK